MVAVAVGTLLALSSGVADAQSGSRAVDVVEVSGYLDEIVADFLLGSLRSAEASSAEALVVQLDSGGATIGEDRVDALAERLASADVPVVVWVGPSGARARGDAGRLVLGAPLAGMAPGARLDAGGAGTVDPEEALELDLVGLTREQSADLQNLLIALDGREVAGRVLDTADFDRGEGGQDPRATLNVEARLAKLPFGDSLMHTVASPAVAWMLLCTGLVLLVFEYFTAGVGVAGAVGAVSLVLAGFGLTVLPTSPLGLALVVLGVFGLAVDVQTGAPRVWTGVGVVALTAGALLLFDDGVDLGWLPLVAGVVGVTLLMLAGLPATVRSRFSTPTIGRASMIGEAGLAEAPLRPDGVVRVRDALWPAYTNRATPVAKGQRVKVIGIDGTRLEVEPEEGAARDHRDRRPKPTAGGS